MIDFGKYKNILVVSHDAGGAEVLSSFINHMGISCDYLIAGPALKIFRDKCKNVDSRICSSINLSYDLIFTSTSWQSELEYESLAFSKENNISSISLIDHWCNYKERFTRNKKTILPDFIFVSDKNAFNLASKTFPNSKIHQVENYFYLDLLDS